MSYEEEVRDSKDYNNYKLTADKVIQVLDGVREERTKSRRRWIWELMQNAKDVPNKSIFQQFPNIPFCERLLVSIYYLFST